jgi:hypothetical protein
MEFTSMKLAPTLDVEVAISNPVTCIAQLCKFDTSSRLGFDEQPMAV